MTFDETAKIIAVISAAIPGMNQKDLYFTQQVWHEILGEHDYQLVKAATMKVLSTMTTWPTPAHIVKAIENLNPVNGMPSAADAWLEVQKAIQQHGWYNWPSEFSTAALTKTVTAIGKDEFCLNENAEATRAHFFKIYAQFANAERDSRENPKYIGKYAPDLMKLTEGLSEKMAIEAPKGKRV